MLSIGATVYATTGTYHFDILPNAIDETNFETKDDNEQKAYITITDVELRGCCEAHEWIFWFRVRNTDNEPVTNAASWDFWNKNWTGETRTLAYTSYQPKNTALKLRGQLDEISSTMSIEGRRTP